MFKHSPQANSAEQSDEKFTERANSISNNFKEKQESVLKESKRKGSEKRRRRNANDVSAVFYRQPENSFHRCAKLIYHHTLICPITLMAEHTVTSSVIRLDALSRNLSLTVYGVRNLSLKSS